MLVSDAQVALALGAFEDAIRRGSGMDAMRGVLEAALSLPQGAPEWQPIETAPKDGTRILVAHEQAAFDAWWSEDDFGWVDGATNNFDDALTYKPTRWMPMPALPASPDPEGL